MIATTPAQAQAPSNGDNTQAPAPASAAAHDEQGPGHEIIITAQKREERLIDVPISLTALSADELTAAGVTQFHDLAQVTPGFTSEEYGDARAGRMTLRGVTSQQDNPGKQSSIGVFLDGVFLARYGAATSELADIERVEVLRGPQGTLFGANTAAGLINIITRRPSLDETSGFVEGVLGEDSLWEMRGSVTAPLVADHLGFSLSAYSARRGGLTDNVTTGRRVDNIRRLGGRAKLYYRGAGFDILLSGDFQRERSECCSAIPVALAPGANVLGQPLAPLIPPGSPYVRETIENTRNTNFNQGGGVSGVVNVDLGDHVLTSVTAWRRWDVSPLSDIDSLPLRLLDNFIIDQRHDQFSQELRIASPSNRRLTYVAGLYYFWRRSDDREVLQPGADAAFVIIPGEQGDTTITSRLNDRSYAAFAHLDFNLTDRLTLSAGGRYTRENQNVDFTQTSTNFVYATLGNRLQSRHESQFTWVLSARYRLQRDLNAYVSVARGFKPGGFDLTRLPNFNNFEFDAETNTNYEIGLKGEVLDRRLRFSTALFLTNYRNFQAQAFDGLNLVTRNADLFRTKGGEIEITAMPTDRLTLELQASYVRARYVSFAEGSCVPGIAPPCDLSGARLPNAPEFTLGGSIQYRAPLTEQLTGYVRVDGNHKSGIYYQQNLDPYAYQGPRTIFNAHVGIEARNGLTIEAFVRNLFDEDYVNFIYPSPLSTGLYVGYVGEPRQFGVRARYTF
jgi:iron complex outermembrane receptor protein